MIIIAPGNNGPEHKTVETDVVVANKRAQRATLGRKRDPGERLRRARADHARPVPGVIMTNNGRIYAIVDMECHQFLSLQALRSMLDSLLNDLISVHASPAHGVDGAEYCEYCQDIRTAKAFLKGSK